MTAAPDLLVVCLDGADWRWFAHHGGAGRFPAITAACAHRADLASTVVPQTPVAWTAFLAGAGPERTGVWGWDRVGSDGVRRMSGADLPAAAFDWGGMAVVLAGLPFLGDGRRGTVRTLAGLGGPTGLAGGSRPAIPAGTPGPAQVALWERHHDRWVGRIAAASAAHGARLVIAHCDVVDWFSHRHGPAAPPSARAWALADRFLAGLRAVLRPRSTLVVSDHGSAEVRCFVRIHAALHRAGLMALGPQDVAALDGLAGQPVLCASDYGALWCDRDDDLLARAAALLVELGGQPVARVAAPGAPSLVPRFPEGWIALTPPAMDPGDGPLLVTGGPAFDRLRAANWLGDHARTGLVGTDDAALWAALDQAPLAGVKAAVLAHLRGSQPPGDRRVTSGRGAPACA